MKRKLGNLEKAQVITNEHYPYNAVIALRLTNGPSEQALEEALKILQRRHPLLRARVEKEKKDFFFICDNTPPIPLNITTRQNDDHWRDVLEDKLNQRMDLVTGPPVHVTYLTTPDSTESEIIFSFQHSIIDEASGANILSELLTLCNKMDSGLPREPLIDLELSPPAEAFFPSFYKGFGKKWHMAFFLLRQMVDEFQYRLRSIGKRKAPLHWQGKCRTLSLLIPKETSEALGKVSRKHRVTISNMFNAAMLMTAHKHLYRQEKQPLRHFCFANLRSYLSPPLPSVHVGSYFSMMRFTVNMNGSRSLLELTKKLNDTTYCAFRRGDKFAFNLMSPYIMDMILRFKSFRMGTTALSFTGVLNLEKQFGRIKVRNVHAYASNFVVGPEYSALVRWFNGGYCWDIFYLDSDMDEKKAQTMAAEILSILEKSIAEEEEERS